MPINLNTLKKGLWEILLYTVLILLGIVMMSPFIWMLSVSFERYANIQAPFPPRMIPQEPSVFNYKIVVENGTLFKAYWSSFVVGVGTVITTIVTTLMGGYAFSKGNFKGRKILFSAILATMMIPMEARLIPMFMMFNGWGLVNTYLPLILTVPMMGFGVLLTKQYMDSLPNSLREAAWIDGAGEFKIFFKIFIPLSGPMIATIIILVFMGSWNDFLWPLVVLTSQKLQTIPIYLSKFSMEDGTAYAGLSMALSSMSIIPVIIVFLFFQKYIIRSVALSGIKGE